MNRHIWSVVLILLLMLSSGAAAVMAADSLNAQISPAAQEGNMISLAKAGPLAQIIAASVVLLMIVIALAPLLLGYEAGAGISI